MALAMMLEPRLLPDLIMQVDREIDWLDQTLTERGKHLVGTDFGRADLNAASLLAPIALPQVEPVKSISAGLNWPYQLASALTRWSNQPTLQWARRLYADYRIPVS